MPVVDRSHLPIRRPTFAGVVNRTLAGSQPDWNLIGHPTPPDGAPNVLLVLIDDAGFGNPSTFGGPIQTPNYTRMAEGGVRYNRFHVTAICSPTRAALLTGRNSHAVGFGSVGEFAGGYPGYSATLPRDCAPLPRILRDNGYSTAAFGKWHLTPDGQQGPAGPFDRWPTGWGFEYFYGFLGGGAGQWDTVIAENQKIIGVDPAYGDEEQPYYLPDAMADKTIEWLHGIRAQDAKKPFFAFFSTGCSHAPHHVAESWAAKYKGKFDQGWDRLREETFARQQALGVVPPEAELTPRNEAFPAWDDVPDKLKAFYSRQMEVYAGFSENADHNVGRVIDAIDELGELDNTLVIWIWGDNGASMEGTVTGSFNELTMQNGIPLTDEMQLQLSERYGGSGRLGRRDHGAALRRRLGLGRQHPVPVGQAGGLAPRRHPQPDGRPLAGPRRGGRRAPVAVRARDRHRTDHPRHRRHPRARDGRRHRPAAAARGRLHGLPDGAGRARAAHAAVLRVGRQPRDVQGRLVAVDAHGPHPVGPHAAGDRAVRPGCLGSRRRSDRALLPARRLQPGARPGGRAARTRWRSLGSSSGRRPSSTRCCRSWPRSRRSSASCRRCPQTTKLEFRGDVQNVLSGMIPRVYNHSYTISADLVVPAGGVEGVIVAEADHLGGFSLFVEDGKLTHTYSMMGVFIFRQQASEPLPEGDVNVRMEFAADAPKPATGGQVTLYVNDQAVGGGRMEHTVPMRFSGYAGMDIGRDNGGVVDRSYAAKAPFPFTGTIHKVVFDIKPHLEHEEADLHEATKNADVAHALSA